MSMSPLPKRLLPLGALAMVAGWSSSAYAQLDVSATVGLGFNVSSLTGPPSTCTSNGNPASCYLTGAIGYYNGTASASGSASDSVLAVSSAALTEGDHYGTGTPTTSVSTSFGDTLAIHNAPTSGILSLTLGYDLQSCHLSEFQRESTHRESRERDRPIDRGLCTAPELHRIGSEFPFVSRLQLRLSGRIWDWLLPGANQRQSLARGRFSPRRSECEDFHHTELCRSPGNRFEFGNRSAYLAFGRLGGSSRAACGSRASRRERS
jgi:hypothetical protein